MKELVIVSGKGGTGKTSISAALSFLAPQKVIADCDVDAANFHLISGHTVNTAQDFYSGYEPYLDEQACTHCGKCTELCRFNAIRSGIITPLNCEGCGVCSFYCPQKAITMKDRPAGQWFISDTRFGKLIHAELGLAVENSGKLVSKVRQEAKKIAQENELPLIIVDGPPGIGCPAIAAITGASLALAVVEPSLSGFHDLKRLASLVSHFKIPLTVCINKSTVSPRNVSTITEWCKKNNIPIAGQIPYSNTFRNAVQAQKTIMEMNDKELENTLLSLWHNITNQLGIFNKGVDNIGM